MEWIDPLIDDTIVPCLSLIEYNTMDEGRVEGLMSLQVVLDIQVSKPGVLGVNSGRDDITHSVIKRLV